MMYYDIYVSGLFVPVSPPKDAPCGVHVDGPGPLDFVCYAFRTLNQGRKQALCTEEQLDAIDAAGIPYQTFANLPSDEKDPSGGPAHVYGDSVYGRDGATIKRYRPGSGEPEVIS